MPTLHLLANGVKEDISQRILSYWYNEHFRMHCDDPDFLSIIPFDPKISTAPSGGIFPTQKFYYSSLAERMRVLVSDLFECSAYISLTGEARFVAKHLRPAGGFGEMILRISRNERIPLHLLVATAFTMALVMFGKYLGVAWEYTSEAEQIIALPISLAFVWLATSVLSGVVLEQDASSSRASAKWSWRDPACWKDLGKVIYGALCGIAGIALFWLIALVFFKIGSKMQNTAIGIDILNQVTLVILCSFALMVGFVFTTFFSYFFMRCYRTFLFRCWSLESLYRVFIIGVSVPLWYGIFIRIY